METWLKRKLSKLSNTMISIYTEVKETFTSNEYRHYVFSPHELTRWSNGIKRYKNDNEIEIDDFIIEVSNKIPICHITGIILLCLQIVCKEAIQIFGNKLVNDADRTKLSAILNNIFLSDWGKSYLTDKVIGSFYIPSFTSTRASSNLSKLQPEDWFNMIRKGLMQYGK